MVNTLRSDPQTSEEEHFKLMLVQTEMERVKYLVRSYVRTRLHKVCLYFPPPRSIGRGTNGRLRNTLHISLLPLNYIIYYQERNYNMPSGMSLPLLFPSLSYLYLSAFPLSSMKRFNRSRN
jgi:hypothetical protein